MLKGNNTNYRLLYSPIDLTRKTNKQINTDMKTKSLFFAALIAISLAANAKNEKQTVDQVTNGVELSADVDYVITGKEPFSTSGSINITNTEHAVIIFQNLKPSRITDAILSHITINGAPAVKGDLTSANAIKGSNCQIKMYNMGAILMPYAQNIKPLTVFSEPNFEGESYNDYSEGNNSGYMKTLSDAQFNNKIRSFKLKRGYMVTFAVGTGGWGYSRCFIADNEDLEISSLPAILDKRISSYRIFKWWNSSKKGVHHTGKEANDKMNTTWAFDWGQGNAGLLPDVEWVPNHIYEDWPSSATCGGVTGSCNMKTNNEPANSADDHPQDVQTVLNNWENLMRTGMRLCSPATHDGGWGWHDEFMKAIDERGWRCDMVDFHGYWDGEWGSLDWRIDRYAYGRPVWFSEWLWGASWNHNGAFANGRQNDNATYDGTKPILERLNANTRVERYAYWNSEQWYTQIYRDNKLTKLGEYFSAMDAGLGYNAKNEYIPKDTKLAEPNDPTAKYNKATTLKPASIDITWTCPNGDLMEEIIVQVKLPGSSTWVTAAEVEPKDKNSRGGVEYSATYFPEEPGTYIFRVKETAYNKRAFTTGEATANVAPAQGDANIQNGKLTVNKTASETYTFSETMESAPCVFIGAMTNNNNSFYAGNVTAVTINKNSFSYQILPWSTNKGSLDKTEDIPFLAMPEGNYTFGNLDCEVGTIKSNKPSGDNLWTDATEVTFAKPFPEGVTPVVLTEIRKPGYTTKTALAVRIFDVTNTGFKFCVYPEDASKQKVALAQTVCYLAITPGYAEETSEGSGMCIAAGHGTTQVYGSSARAGEFIIKNTNDAGEIVDDPYRFVNPTTLVQLQTNNYPTIMMVRNAPVTEKVDNTTWTTGYKVRRIADHNITIDGKEIPWNTTSASNAAYFDNMGWVVIAQQASSPTAIHSLAANATVKPLTPRVVNGMIYVDGVSNFEVYTMSGAKVASKSVQNSGVYIIKAGNRTAKVVVK